MTAVLRPIGHVRSSLHDTASAPRQASESAGAGAEVHVDPAYADGLLGLDGYRWIWLVTLLDQGPAGPPPLRLVPCGARVGGRVQGVFASRAPVRPNPIGLSLVELVAVEGTVLRVRGIDLLDGTPVLDIKPWFDDCDRPGAAPAATP